MCIHMGDQILTPANGETIPKYAAEDDASKDDDPMDYINYMYAAPDNFANKSHAIAPSSHAEARLFI